MKPLATYQHVLKMLCAFPPDESTERWKKVLFVISGLSIFVCILCTATSSLTFVLKHLINNPAEGLWALFQVCGLTNMLYVLIISFVIRFKIKEIFDKLSQIYDMMESDESFEFLEQTNDLCERMWQLYFKFVVGGFVVVFPTMVLISLAYCWQVYGGFDPNHVFYLFKLIVPWNQHTFVGYIGEFFYSIIDSEAYFFANGAFLLTFISLCLHHNAFAKMYGHSVQKLGESDYSTEKRRLLALIQLDIHFKNWFLDSAETYSPFILVQLISSMIYTAISVFQLDVHLKHIDFSITILLIVFVNSTINVFLYCFFGKLATFSHRQVADCLFESEWIELPLDLQKYLILMISHSHREIHFNGFGLAVLNLETFTKFMRSVYSYYMIFKTITSI